MWEKPVLLPPWVSDVSHQALLQPCMCENVCECVCAWLPVWETFMCGCENMCVPVSEVCVCRTVGGLPLWILSVFFSKNDIPKLFQFSDRK